MIANERIRALAALDREALIALLAAAYQQGAHGLSELQADDPDVQDLIHAARRRVAAPWTTTSRLDDWQRRAAAWSADDAHEPA